MKYEELLANNAQQLDSLKSQLTYLEQAHTVEVNRLAKFAEGARVEYQFKYYGNTPAEQQRLQDQLDNANKALADARSTYANNKTPIAEQIASIEKSLYSISDEGVAEAAKAELTRSW